MKKKYIILLLVALLIITGCSKGVKEKDEKTGKEKTVYTCVKKGIEDSSSTSGTKWKEDITFTAKLDDDGKLNYYSSLFKYMYNSKEDCDYWCDIKVNWNDEINAKNYPGGHRETNCACDKNELTEKYVYDDIPNLANILRSDINQLKDDNTFDLDDWIQKKEKNGYNCS